MAVVCSEHKHSQCINIYASLLAHHRLAWTTISLFDLVNAKTRKEWFASLLWQLPMVKQFPSVDLGPFTKLFSSEGTENSLMLCFFISVDV